MPTASPVWLSLPDIPATDRDPIRPALLHAAALWSAGFQVQAKEVKHQGDRARQFWEVSVAPIHPTAHIAFRREGQLLSAAMLIKAASSGEMATREPAHPYLAAMAGAAWAGALLLARDHGRRWQSRPCGRFSAPAVPVDDQSFCRPWTNPADTIGHLGFAAALLACGHQFDSITSHGIEICGPAVAGPDTPSVADAVIAYEVFLRQRAQAAARLSGTADPARSPLPPWHPFFWAASGVSCYLRLLEIEAQTLGSDTASHRVFIHRPAGQPESDRCAVFTAAEWDRHEESIVRHLASHR